MNPTEPIAIVGFAIRFPGCGSDLELFWNNIAEGIDCSREVPADRWILPASQCQDARIPHPDSVYGTRGYYLDPFEPDLTGLKIDPNLVDQLDPLFHLVLDVGNRAWKSAKTANVDTRKVGVILGNICLPTDKSNALARSILGNSEEHVHPLNRYVAGLPAGLLAKALQLGGGTFTLDAACASSLYAFKLACDELLSGRADVMLAGGASRPDCQYTQMGFSQLKALSTSGKCSPFDANADGLMVGEGAGIFVLKRLSDAERDGDRIHGVFRGWGLSNDTQGNLLAPAVEGQLRAMHDAYKMADWDPTDVELIECHATGTPVGDAIELESLLALWKGCRTQPGQCVIGSVKSTVGHLLTGAGSAALAKVLVAMAKQMRPPQANFHTPNNTLIDAAGPFQVLQHAEPWTPHPDDPRRAAVSGFGFGGVNAHLLVEEYRAAEPKSELVRTFQAFRRSLPRLTASALLSSKEKENSQHEPIAIVGLAAHIGPWKNAAEFQEYVLGGNTKFTPKPKHNGWGQSKQSSPAGHFIEELVAPVESFRIPPKELEEMLPQQLLMLQVAADAIADAGGTKPEPDPRTGVFVGLGLDLNTTNYHLRWAQVAEGHLPGDDAPPPLNANRTMGALGSIAASRIARVFRFGGPSFTVCSEETSAGTALQLAVRALRLKELDRAVVGGVDLAGDPRQVLANAEAGRPASGTAAPLEKESAGILPAEGAAAVVLKRLKDAERDSDHVYAVIRGVGVASGGEAALAGSDASSYATSLIRACADGLMSPESLDYLEAASTGAKIDDAIEADAIGALMASTERDDPLHIGAARGQVGSTGAASVLVGLVKTCMVLEQEILPPTVAVESVRAELVSMRSQLHSSKKPQFWLANRGAPRNAAIAGLGADGSSVHVVLEEYRGKSKPKHSSQPLGTRSEAIFHFEGSNAIDLLAKIGDLKQCLLTSTNRPIEWHARAWLSESPQQSNGKLAAAVVARSISELQEQCAVLELHLQLSPELPFPVAVSPEMRPSIRDRVFYSPSPLGPRGKLAFVFPGSGSHFAGMGRELGRAFPDILRQQQNENTRLREQYAPSKFWGDIIPDETSAKQFLFGQVALGTLVSDILLSLKVKPDAVVGQSLGESASLFGVRIWRDRDEMLNRIQKSTLFESDLAAPYHAARRAFGFPEDAEVDWVCGVMPTSADDVRPHLRPGLRVYLLIVNTPNECVIGGIKADVETLLASLNQPFVALSGVTLAHCEAGKPVEKAYRDLHTLPVSTHAGIKVFSGAWARSYNLTSANAADSITAGLLNAIDFPAVVEAAYADGVRAFIEVGPGSSCTRFISSILAGRQHVARAVCAPRVDSESALLRTIAQLITERFPVDLSKLYGGEAVAVGHRDEPAPSRHSVVVPVGMPAQHRHAPQISVVPMVSVHPEQALPAPQIAPASLPSSPAQPIASHYLNAAVATAASAQSSLAMAHATYLRVQHNLMASAFAALELQNEIIRRMSEVTTSETPVEKLQQTPAPRDVPRALNFEQCTEYAVGKIGNVLGSTFAEVDSYPTRVRLPEGPLMLVDRILKIEGEPRSMTRGRVVTDHTVHAQRWYLDNGRCPTSITVESGQADLFLSGFLGIDFQTRGKAVYRLLDAVVEFHRGLPKIGERIEYDISIDEFFQQADAWLFRFRFEGSINGEPLLSMKNGIAGFFTQAALDAGQGIIHTKLDKQTMPGKKPSDWRELVPVSSCSLSEEQVNALYAGQLTTAFGSDFTQLKLKHPIRLPGGMLKLVDRVPLIDPNGGRFGIGFVRAEYDIKPHEWFIECHFVDDKVMPGTLMYECCLHTLRTLLMRMGWICEQTEAICEPVPGVNSRLKCRGQVLDTTKLVTYEVTIKELGTRPEMYCIADALMYADGKPIVEITNMSLRMTGLTRDRLTQIWQNEPIAESPNQKPRYDSASIMAFSNGKPSEAFGEPYRVFDSERIIARLPGPPYQFLDRVMEVQGEPFVLKEGASCIAEYDVPVREWYFDANRCPRMPFSILLEIALQPCGWLAAYCGSALTSDSDLSFRNLGGNGKQLLAVGPEIGTLTTSVTMTRVSKSGGMIIQNFDLRVKAGEQTVYEGDTYFGYFAKSALVNQVGMPQAKVPFLNEDQRAFADTGHLPHEAPFPLPMLRMVDEIMGYLPRGGRNKLGLIQGRIAVDPSFWFFQAHFYQDPVWPGSLGLESFLQLLKFVAWKKWKSAPKSGWQTVGINQPHSWTYRGQVVPQDREVIVVLEVTEVDEVNRRFKADGFLTVDGRIIYQMTNFTLE